jgi:hypothetical protein
MLSVRDVPLPEEARRALDGVVAAAPAQGSGLWARLKSAAALDRKFLAARAEAARAVLARGTCQTVAVSNDAAPALSAHEHGIFLFVPVSAGETLLLDVSSVSEDPRWALHGAGGLLRQRWRWLRFPGLEGPWCFAAEGAPVTPRDLGEFHGTALERRLTEEVDWPGDDAVIPLGLAEIERLVRQPAGAAA